MEHVKSHIVGWASLDEIGEVREGQEVEFLASLVVVLHDSGPLKLVMDQRVDELVPWCGCAGD